MRYGGNTSCVAVRLGNDELIVLDCGTGARALGLSLMSGPFGQGKGNAALLLSHAHWDHIQGFPFFGPLYVPGNVITIYGSNTQAKLEEIFEGQMAAQYFPVQTIKNMGSTIHMHTADTTRPFPVSSASVRACANPHGPTGALAFRIEQGGKALVYASDAGYGATGPDAAAIDLYRGADLLVHDCTYTPEDRARHLDRGLSSLTEAVDAAVKAGVKRLGLFHYDQDYSDHDVDELIARGRRALDEKGGQTIEIFGATEGLTVTL